MPRRRLDELGGALAEVARHERFSGVAVVEVGGVRVVELVAGMANRAESIPMSLTTRLATASGTKGFTALAVMSMIEDGLLRLDTTVREVVGDDLPHVDPSVTVEHLLGHRSGVGDYLDESVLGDVDEYVLSVPVHRLVGPDDYLPLIAPLPPVSPPGERFAYNNSGYVMLALLVDRVGASSYHEEVRRRVFEPAGMVDSEFLRSDRLPTGTALGYLADGRTNVHHLPVIGTGDGGAYTTAPDLMRFWDALLGGRIVDPTSVARMTSVSSDGPSGRYGLGFWLDARTGAVVLEGMDAGVSFRSGAVPGTGTVFCVVANDSHGAWPLARVIDDALAP